MNDKKKDMYVQMRGRQRRKHSAELLFSYNDFCEWLNTQPFEELYEAYEVSRFDKNLAPSVDRIDDSKNYHFENMQLLTSADNSQKRRDQEKLAIVLQNGYYNSSLYQYTLSGEFIASYKTSRIAALMTGGNAKAILAASDGSRVHSGGFQWRKTFTTNLPAIIVMSKRPNKVLWCNLVGEELGRFDTYKEASVASGVPSSRIGEVVRGDRRQANGYVFSKLKKIT